MRVSISFPPLESGKGVPLLAQNRQFQWFNSPTYIYPMIPASAATLLKRNGHDVIWDDGIAEGIGYSRWLDRVIKVGPDVVAIETKTPVIKRHWKIINQIKERNPKIRVVLMGDHVTALPEESLKNSLADFVITGGDFDFSLAGICDFVSGKGKLPRGVWYRKLGGLKNTGRFSLRHDLNSLPFIDRDLTRWRLYSEKNGNYKRLPGTYTMAGRDCWYHKCTFCSWTTIFPTFRARSPENLLEEIGILIDRYGIREIMDDTGTFPVGPWLEKFCMGMIENGYNMEVIMDCNMRFGALSLEQYRLMKRAGFRLLLFGLESGEQKSLDRVNKSLRVEQITKSCKNAKRAGLEPHITIMFGYPWEGRKEAQKTLDLGRYLLRKGYANTVQATLVIPYPGTPLFEECRKKGLLKTLDWERYDMRETVMKTPMSEEEIQGMVQNIYRVAFHPEFVARKVAGIRNADDLRFMKRAGKKVLGHIKDFSGKG
jgi:anaerobic magnesium-protoporphyrin IX monomethyl ester cyclase